MENQVPPQNSPQPAPQAPQSTPTPTTQPQAQGQKPSFDLDPRTKLTIQWSAIWYAVGSVIEFVFGYMSIYFVGGIEGEFLRAFGGFFETFPFGVLIREIIVGSIIGAIAGFVISKFYHYLQEWNVKYLKGKLDTFFKLLFYPSLAGAIIGFLLTSTASFAIGFMPIIIVFVGVVLSSFIYAKMLTKKVGAQYPAPNQSGGMPAPAPRPAQAAPAQPTQPSQPTQPPQPPQQPTPPQQAPQPPTPPAPPQP